MGVCAEWVQCEEQRSSACGERHWCVALAALLTHPGNCSYCGQEVCVWQVL